MDVSRRGAGGGEAVSDKFQIGDCVEWKSQARSYTTHKAGKIVGIVPPMGIPDRARFIDLFKGAGCGLMGRKEESYVVAVKFPRSVRHYWPRVKHLRKVSAHADTGTNL